MENYVELTDIPDEPRFGNITLLFNPLRPADRVMRTAKTSGSPEEFRAANEQAEDRRKINSQYIMNLVGIEANEEQLKTLVYFEYPEETVHMEEMKQPEAVKMFVEILESICFLQANKMIHGDIRPEYISFSEADKRYKLMDRLCDLSPPLQCQLNNITKLRSLYMAPLIFDELSKKSKKIKQNSYKSELFSLGMVALGAFKHPDVLQEFYDLDNQCFERAAFLEFLDELVEKPREPLLKDFLLFLREHVLELDEKKRLSPRKALLKLRENPLFRPLIKSVEADGRGEEGAETVTNTLKFYNPFDFVDPMAKLGSHMPDLDQDNESKHISKEVVKVKENMMIAPVARERSLVMTSQKWRPEDLEDEKSFEAGETAAVALTDSIVPSAEETLEKFLREKGSLYSQESVSTPVKDNRESLHFPQQSLEKPGQTSSPKKEAQVQLSSTQEKDSMTGAGDFAGADNPPQNSIETHPPTAEQSNASGPAEEFEQKRKAAAGSKNAAAPHQETISYFQQLGIDVKEEPEADLLEHKVRDSEFLNVYTEDLMYQDNGKASKQSRLSDFVRNREYERLVPVKLGDSDDHPGHPSANLSEVIASNLRQETARNANATPANKPGNAEQSMAESGAAGRLTESHQKSSKSITIGGSFNFTNRKNLSPAREEESSLVKERKDSKSSRKFVPSIESNYNMSSALNIKRSGTSGNLLKAETAKKSLPAASKAENAGKEMKLKSMSVKRPELPELSEPLMDSTRRIEISALSAPSFPLSQSQYQYAEPQSKVFSLSRPAEVAPAPQKTTSEPLQAYRAQPAVQPPARTFNILENTSLHQQRSLPYKSIAAQYGQETQLNPPIVSPYKPAVTAVTNDSSQYRFLSTKDVVSSPNLTSTPQTPKNPSAGYFNTLPTSAGLREPMSAREHITTAKPANSTYQNIFAQPQPREFSARSSQYEYDRLDAAKSFDDRSQRVIAAVEPVRESAQSLGYKPSKTTEESGAKTEYRASATKRIDMAKTAKDSVTQIVHALDSSYHSKDGEFKSAERYNPQILGASYPRVSTTEFVFQETARPAQTSVISLADRQKVSGSSSYSTRFNQPAPAGLAGHNVIPQVKFSHTKTTINVPTPIVNHIQLNTPPPPVAGIARPYNSSYSSQSGNVLQSYYAPPSSVSYNPISSFSTKTIGSYTAAPAVAKPSYATYAAAPPQEEPSRRRLVLDEYPSARAAEMSGPQVTYSTQGASYSSAQMAEPKVNSFRSSANSYSTYQR